MKFANSNHCVFRELLTGLGEAGAEAGTLDQLVSLTGEQAASVEEVFSVVTPAEVRRIKMMMILMMMIVRSGGSRRKTRRSCHSSASR